jgi:hypothetical protein
MSWNRANGIILGLLVIYMAFRNDSPLLTALFGKKPEHPRLYQVIQIVLVLWALAIFYEAFKYRS